MSDAVKYKIMRTTLLLIAAFVLLWIVVQLALGANASAAIEDGEEHCLTARSYIDCMDGTR